MEVMVRRGRRRDFEKIGIIFFDSRSFTLLFCSSVAPRGKCDSVKDKMAC